MNFFVDGGFQQLFNELNQELLDCEQVQTDDEIQTLHYEDLSPKYNINNNNININYKGQYEFYEKVMYKDDQLYRFADNDNNNYELINLNNAISSTTKSKTKTIDSNNNFEFGDNYDVNQNLFESKNILEFLPTLDISNNTDDFAEWEHKFLENYIEIPELIDFLPEKTPLCNANCFDFLEESSQNLRLLPTTTTTTTTLLSTANADEQLNGDNIVLGYPCTFGTCQKIYAKPAHLKAHLRRHLGEKPYVCTWPECTWKFSRSDELARHRRSHSGVKPYKCDYCAKCFARSDHLTKHRKVHERRLLAASKAGKAINGVLPSSVYAVRPGRRRKNQI